MCFQATSLNPKPIRTREVFQDNLEIEFKILGNIIDRYPNISMDTEFPGVVFRPTVDGQRRIKPEDLLYHILKANVDALDIIQIGITLTDSSGNLPDLGTNHRYIWEFNFRDFDISTSIHALDSIELLKQQGINFEKNRAKGIDSRKFAELMMSSGLVCNDSVSWVTFHSAYDFGYLIKMLTCRNLPEDKNDFLKVMKVFFGIRVYDVKYIIRFCNGLFGGLDRLGELLNVERLVGKCHQAGSDSLLTWHVFERIKQIRFANSDDRIQIHAGVLFGL